MDPRTRSFTTKQRRLFLQRFPCMDDEPMDVNTHPPVTAKSLAVPRLRKCPFDIDTINWQRARMIGIGADGCVYRVHFGDQGPFALKLFWTPELIPQYPWYSAVHRECQNAALLQMLRASVDQAAAAAAAVAAGNVPSGPTMPPHVDPNPTDFSTACHNLFAFAEEVRRYHQEHSSPSDLVPVTSMPRFAQCFGWLPCKVHELMRKMPRRIRVYRYDVDYKNFRTFDPERTDFIAIVYEYIQSDDSDGDSSDNGGEDQPSIGTVDQNTTVVAARRYNTRASARQAAQDAMQEAIRRTMQEAVSAKNTAGTDTLNNAKAGGEAKQTAKDVRQRERVSAVADFLWLAGFDFCIQPLGRNWKNGVLVDHSDIIGPYSPGWQRHHSDRKWSVDQLLTPHRDDR